MWTGICYVHPPLQVLPVSVICSSYSTGRRITQSRTNSLASWPTRNSPDLVVFTRERCKAMRVVATGIDSSLLVPDFLILTFNFGHLW